MPAHPLPRCARCPKHSALGVEGTVERPGAGPAENMEGQWRLMIKNTGCVCSDVAFRVSWFKDPPQPSTLGFLSPSVTCVHVLSPPHPWLWLRIHQELSFREQQPAPSGPPLHLQGTFLPCFSFQGDISSEGFTEAPFTLASR